MICAVCRREFGYEGWFLPDKRRVCSYRCFNLALGGTIMIDPSPFELDAMTNASIMGGEYLESIDKTDLMTMSVDEWLTFINVVCTGYSDSLTRAHRGLEEDLARVREHTEPPLPF